MHDSEKHGSSWGERYAKASPAVQEEMLRAKIAPTESTLSDNVGTILAPSKALQELASIEAEDLAVVRTMDATRGKRNKADIRKKHVRSIGKALIEQYPFAKIDPEIVEKAQERLKRLAAIRPEFAYRDSYVLGLIKGEKRGRRTKR